MPTSKKPASSTKSSAAKASAKPKASTKKPAASTAVARQKPTAVTVAKPVAPMSPAAKKASLNKTTVGVSVSRTSNPRTNTVTITKITRNIVQFHMTEDIEIRRVTKSDNVSKEKLKAKYASLKAKVKS
ncbi:hypothetical protein MUN81_06740 [Hymenobacter sp. 5317J-9]|uniref:hypothetical protein n=1 Tax=Hymenobacter sp. 5317J-9 TaxID=2932250 RepID=UPI001FD6C3C0|nr:hypothetical protein [Hymenobacter sp. 5317J-9]UOQ99186.1 hypothetical protein MUN81_06740 [Hymenobacter sp. 5317J-9]